MKKQTTKKEKQYMSRVADLGCYVCGGIASVHHIRPKGTGMGRRSSHYETIPLCYEHHQGNNSIHNRKLEFERKYGTEKEILQIITERLK